MGGVSSICRRSEARLVPSSTFAVASRTSFMARWTPQTASLGQSAQAHVGGLAGAGHRGQRAIEHPDDLAQVDVGRIAGQEVPPALPFPALQDALVLEAEQDQLEELGRDLLLAGPGRRSASARPRSWSARASSALMAYLARLESMVAYMYPSRRSVSSPPPSSLSCARPERSAMLANLPVCSSTMISSTFRASDSTALVQG